MPQTPMPSGQLIVHPAVATEVNARTRATRSLLVRPDMTTPFCRAGPGPSPGSLIVIRWSSKENGFCPDGPPTADAGFLAPDVQVVNGM